MPDRPRWTTLNLAALSAAIAVLRAPRLAELVDAAAGRDDLLARLVARAPGDHDAAERRALERAVVLERVSGTDWGRIGALLGTTAREAELRHAGAERAFLTAEAFRERRSPSGAVRRVEPEVLRDADAWTRTLDGLAPSWAPRPSAALVLDDHTWLTHEFLALDRIGAAIRTDDLPDGVDPLEARLTYEGRRLQAIAWDLGRERRHDAALDGPIMGVAEATATRARLRAEGVPAAAGGDELLHGLGGA